MLLEKLSETPDIFTSVFHVNKQSRQHWRGRGQSCLSKENEKKTKEADGHNRGNWKSIMSPPFTKAASATTKKRRQNPLFLSCLFENQRAEQRNIPAGEMVNIGS